MKQLPKPAKYGLLGVVLLLLLGVGWAAYGYATFKIPSEDYLPRNASQSQAPGWVNEGLDPSVVPDGALSFAVFSDVHIKKRIFGCAGGYSDIPSNRFRLIGQNLNPSNLGYTLDFTMTTGDLVADLYDSVNGSTPNKYPEVLKKYGQWVSRYFSSAVPHYVTLGNHDNRQCNVNSSFGCDFEYYPWSAPAVWHSMVAGHGYAPLKFPDGATVPDDEMYYAWREKGWVLIALDTGRDVTNHGNDGSFRLGSTQEQWLEGILDSAVDSDGNPMPIMMFWHADSLPSNNQGGINDHLDQIKAIFVGHAHSFKESKWGDIPVFRSATATCRTTWTQDGEDTYGYAEPNFDPYYLIWADSKTGDVAVTNQNEIFKFQADGVSGGGNYSPNQCHIPGDPGSPDGACDEGEWR